MNPIIDISDHTSIYDDIPRATLTPGVRIVVYNKLLVEIRETTRDLLLEWVFRSCE